MNCQFVSFLNDGACFPRVDEGRNRRHEKARRNVVVTQDFENSRSPGPRAVLPLAHASKGLPSEAQFDRLVVAVEGKSHGAASTVVPPWRPGVPAGADVGHNFAPRFVWPLPRLLSTA